MIFWNNKLIWYFDNKFWCDKKDILIWYFDTTCWYDILEMFMLMLTTSGTALLARPANKRACADILLSENITDNNNDIATIPTKLNVIININIIYGFPSDVHLQSVKASLFAKQGMYASQIRLIINNLFLLLKWPLHQTVTGSMYLFDFILYEL